MDEEIDQIWVVFFLMGKIGYKESWEWIELSGEISVIYDWKIMRYMFDPCQWDGPICLMWWDKTVCLKYAVRVGIANCITFNLIASHFMMMETYHNDQKISKMFSICHYIHPSQSSWVMLHLQGFITPSWTWLQRQKICTLWQTCLEALSIAQVMVEGEPFSAHLANDERSTKQGPLHL